jgi:hypothetical protein
VPYSHMADLWRPDCRCRPQKDRTMIEGLYNLPVALMALAIFAVTYVAAAGIYWAVTRLAVDDRARAFKALSPGMLPPLGIIFGLLVAFVAAQVWSDFDRARVAVASEASALRGVVLLASFQEMRKRAYALSSAAISMQP